jgi:hypothetical protein
MQLEQAFREIDAALEDARRVDEAAGPAIQQDHLKAFEARLGNFGELQPSPAIDDRLQKIAALRAALEAFSKARRAAEAGDGHSKQRQWVEADDQYAVALQHWDAHPELMATFTLIGSDGAETPVDVEAQKAAIERKRQRIAQPVATARARLEAERKEREKERAEQAAFAALCGPKPTCGGWDGECVGIASALRRVANDPGSIDVENCTDPRLTRDHCWVTTCDVRGKNAFGALILLRKTFSMSNVGVSEIG